MGRPTRKTKRQVDERWRKTKGPSGAPGVETPYLPPKSREPQFVQYYLRCLDSCFTSPEDKEAFVAILKAPLPACYRLNGGVANARQAGKVLTDCAEACAKQTGIPDDSPALRVSQVEWYPGGLVWQLSLDKLELKRAAHLKPFHQLLIRATNAGLISRQELVSMIPPLLLDVQRDDLVLDMCAAPGSKTAQLLEFLQLRAQNSKDLALLSGGVVANELDFTRAWILSHQVARLSAPNVLVVNHAGQFMPQLESLHSPPARQTYDKILVDVPCSGDAAIRKMPDRYRTWSPMDGVHMHHLQIAILIRAINLAKVGGLVVYSTCSFNPLENESVVAEVILRANKASPGSLELLDIHSILNKGLIMRPGMKHWPLLLYNDEEDSHEKNDFFTEHTYDSAINVDKKNIKKAIRHSHFPPTEKEMLEDIKIQHTARLFPQDQNSGGFYIALFRKNAETHSLYTPSRDPLPQQAKPQKEVKEEKEAKEPELPEEIEKLVDVPTEEINKLIEGDNAASDEEPMKTDIPKNKKAKFLGKADQVSFNFLPESTVKGIQEEYGLSEDFPIHLIVMPNESSRKLYFVSQRIFDLMKSDKKGAINKVFFGTSVFTKSNREDKSEFFRLSHQGAHIIEPFMTKNKFKVSLDDIFWLITKGPVISFTDLSEQMKEHCEAIEAGKSGCFLFVFEHPEEKWKEVITFIKMKKSINLMVAKEDLEGLKLKYSLL